MALVVILLLSMALALAMAPTIENMLSPMMGDTTDDYVCRHNYSMKIISHSPFIAYIDGFLQDREAEHIMSLAETRFTPSETLNQTKTPKYRTSNSAVLNRSQTDIVRCIEERTAQITGIDMASLEYLQVVRYLPGQEYKKHTDYLDIDYLRTNYWGQFGQRFATILAYLHEPVRGGNTSFSALGLSIPTKKNDAVYWMNMHANGTEDVRTTHAGEPVEQGEKWAINLWAHRWNNAVRAMYTWQA
ncbi:hypothetical protein SYNPS1DRAFT_23375 [Syncephalis pseudoplumigaleata]|uniref:Fe2OG dioxygenase domain-containing protein n=1 Tax=Syncephalis pseudoplumigaleata TaxID=1712513 RepID=A0A4P9YYU6_9FUNG|nr:hypothetical protein SYNPS1DRAFT_23375 [Syncephalis pseudoplumigaleata]|eukprot:RKP24551.1 hypothetical protein SYNPS1DRAFT_23375 [Syncephalis pseudoplumigaleata]